MKMTLHENYIQTTREWAQFPAEAFGNVSESSLLCVSIKKVTIAFQSELFLFYNMKHSKLRNKNKVAIKQHRSAISGAP